MKAYVIEIPYAHGEQGGSDYEPIVFSSADKAVEFIKAQNPEIARVEMDEWHESRDDTRRLDVYLYFKNCPHCCPGWRVIKEWKFEKGE